MSDLLADFCAESCAESSHEKPNWKQQQQQRQKGRFDFGLRVFLFFFPLHSTTFVGSLWQRLGCVLCEWKDSEHGFLREKEEIQVPDASDAGGADRRAFCQRGFVLQAAAAGWGLCRHFFQVKHRRRHKQTLTVSPQPVKAAAPNVHI